MMTKMKTMIILTQRYLTAGVCERIQQSRYLLSSLPGSASRDVRVGATLISVTMVKCVQS